MVMKELSPAFPLWKEAHISFHVVGPYRWQPTQPQTVPTLCDQTFSDVHILWGH